MARQTNDQLRDALKRLLMTRPEHPIKVPAALYDDALRAGVISPGSTDWSRVDTLPLDDISRAVARG